MQEMMDLENCILDTWISKNLPQLDPKLIEDDHLFPQWWSNVDFEDGKCALGPLARHRLQARVLDCLASDGIVNPSMELPPPFNSEADDTANSSFKPKWYMLPGIATLNLPVCSEVIEWKQIKHQRTILNWVQSFWMRFWSTVDHWYFTLRLWGISYALGMLERKIENALTFTSHVQF